MEKVISQLQIERDQIAYNYLMQSERLRNEQDETRMLLIIAPFCDFNVSFIRSIPFIARRGALLFIASHSDEIKGRFSVESFIDFCEKWNILETCKINVDNLLDFKERIYKFGKQFTNNKSESLPK